MNITVLQGENSFDREAASRILEQMKVPGSMIGLSSGRTTGNMHRIVAERYNAEPFDISTIKIFAQDEVVGIPATQFRACRAMILNEMVKDIPLKEENFLTFSTDWNDYPQECTLFPQRIGTIDLLILGLGENGHLGSNQPGTPFSIRSNVAKLLPEFYESICKDACLEEGARLGVATIGLADVMEAKRVILVAKGYNKTEIVKKIIEGPVTEDVPASILQRHPNCEYILDDKAAALLQL